MQNIFNYLNLIIFLDDKLLNFLIAFSAYCFILCFILILFFIMSFRLKEGKYNILWPFTILKYILPLICSTFFGQIFVLLISAFKCMEGRLYYNSKASCTIGTWFYVIVPISIVIIILQILLSFITISMYYKVDFIEEGNDFSKKRSSIPDLILLINKIIIITIFGFDKEIEEEHWIIIIVVCFVTGLNAYATLFMQNYENIIIKRFHYFFSLFLFWGFLSLLIGKIFKSWKFNGAFYLFLLGLLLIMIYCLFYAKTYLEFIHYNFEEINSSQIFINYIRGYIKIINRKEICRESSMIITTFIEKMEDRCTNENCFLKKYLISLTKGFDSHFLLLQFAKRLFKIALNKFPKDVTLRIHYIVFLLTKVNQKKNAEKELFSIKPNYFMLDDNFKIYQCKKYLEEYNSIGIKEKEEMNENNDFFLAMEYKNNLFEFKKLLSKSSYLYYDFWTTLHNTHLQGTEDFKKLNDIGAELNEMIENIDKIFRKIQEIQNKDLISIELYESYAKNILNDKEKYEKYHHISMNLITDNKILNKDIDFSNYDLKILNENDEYKYLIISANEENKGIIVNISLNSCELFGYQKHEIIGKSMNILIPEIYHNDHIKLFNENTEKIKTDFFENLTKNKIYQPKFQELLIYGRNKSKYIIPLEIKVLFVQTEDSELVYIVKLYKKDSYNNYLNDNNINEINQICCVLTDNNFLIQTFTPNCVEQLGLNSKIINSNFDITNFIKQFNDELQIMISNKEQSYYSGFETSERKSSDNSHKDFNNINIKDKSYEHILRLKKKLLKEKYLNPRKIIWRIWNNTKLLNFQSDISKGQISLFAPQEIKSKFEAEENKFFKTMNFILEVKKAKISEKHIGYYFYFKSEKVINDLLNKPDKTKNINVPLKSSLKRPSVKFVNFEEESAKSSRFNDDEDNSIVHKSSFGKVSNTSSKKNSIVNFDLENVHYIKRHESATMLGNVYEQNNINDRFIPSCNFNFYLDLENMSFKPSTKLDSCNDLFVSLRVQSLQKINILYKSKKKEKIASSFSSEKSSTGNTKSSYNDSSSSSYTYSSQLESNISNRKSSKENTNTFRRKNHRKAGFNEKSIFTHKSVNINDKNFLNINNDNKNAFIFDNEYYKVNINKIKFMAYDFIQEMVINENIEKKSQIEIIIENYKKNNEVLNKDINYPNISIENAVNEPNNKKKTNSDINLPRKQKEYKEPSMLFNKEKEFEKEISYALSKQDEQKSILYFYQISFLFIIIIILLGLSAIFYVNFKYTYLEENLKLLIKASDLKYDTNIGIYLVREMILCTINNNITNGIYIIPDSSPEIYIFKIMSFLKEIFIEINSILEYIIGTNLQFCQKAKYILEEKIVNIDILYNNSNIKMAKNYFYPTFIHIYSCLCNIISGSSYIADEPNVYNYIHNSFNNIGDMLNTQIELFQAELSNKKRDSLSHLFIYIILYLSFHLLIYVMVYKIYFSIVKKKESYISAFYGIGLPLIKLSIKKCEIFISKLNKDEENLKIKEGYVTGSSLISSSNTNLKAMIIENNFEKKNVNYDKNKKNSTKLKKRNRKDGNDKKSKKFKFLFQILLIASFLYLSLNLILFLIVINFFNKNGNFIFIMQNYHNNIIELFNIYREFLFDENNIIHGLKAYDYLKNKEEEFFSTNTKDINYLTILSQKKENNFEDLQNKGFCNSFIAYFNSENECIDFLGGKDGIMSLGFHLLIHLFLDQMRNSKNLVKSLLDDNFYVGNLSKIIPEDSNNSDYGLDTNKMLFFRMQVFNIREAHLRINIIFLNIILQYIINEKDISEKAILESINNINIKYILLIATYLFLFLLYFSFYWFPMIRRMDNEIYKTKKMLKIIPIQILASQPNIKELLNISKTKD